MDTKTFASTVTRSAMAARLGVGLTAISNGVVAGKFPASWFAVLKQLADEVGCECPLCLFAFVTPATSQEHGDAASPLHPPISEQTVSETHTRGESFTAAP